MIPVKRAVGYGILFFLFVSMMALSSPHFYAGPESVEVYVADGMSSVQIGRVLEDAGLVWDARLFAAVSWIRGVHTDLKSGRYRFRFDEPLVAVIDTLARGQAELVRVTIPEGYSIGQIAKLLEESGVADAKAFETVALTSASEYTGLLGFAPPTGSLEGYLFPDTYLVSEGLPVERLISLMVARFCEKGLPALESADTAGLSVHELVTLASIIEREALLDSERPLVSSVFHNRLTEGVRLQSCATVNYALGRPGKALTATDLTVKSPYNTYLYGGLPPGPIANPGLTSLQAAASPADSPFMYFVSDGSGGHVFSVEYSEHLAAVESLRQLRGD